MYMRASRWLEVPLLLDPAEWDRLFLQLQPIHICQVGRPGGQISVEQLSKAYRSTIDSLLQGQLQVHSFLSCALSVHLECLQSVPLADGRQILQPVRPVIQMQPFHFSFDQETRAFHPRVYGPHTIFWGVLFTMPQLFEDSATQQVCKAIDDPYARHNLERMRSLQRWSRDHTTPWNRLPVRLGLQAAAHKLEEVTLTRSLLGCPK
jgi:hypothetical protein